MSKTTWYVFVTFILMVSCNTGQEKATLTSVKNSSGEVLQQTAGKSQSNALITDSSVGVYEVGNTFERPANKEYVSIMLGAKEALQIYPAYDPRTEKYVDFISKIVIKSPLYKDSKSISVGSTFSEVIRAYPSAYCYYDYLNKNIIVSDAGHGPQYVFGENALNAYDEINFGRIDVQNVDKKAIIQEIRIVRSKQQNNNAMSNLKKEEQDMLEAYLSSVEGNYYLSGYSENYYKIHRLQGDFYVSECFEGDCTKKGKVKTIKKNDAGFISLLLDGVSGGMIPSWTLKEGDTGLELFVYDYDAPNDSWDNRKFVRANR